MKRILIVDDEPNIRDSLRIILSKRGYDVETAYDGINALEKFKLSHFDVVITDIVMPQEDGMGLIMQIQRLNVKVRLITMSGGGKYTDPVIYLNMSKALGVDYTFTKPIDNELLIEAIEGRLKDYCIPV